MLDKFKQMESEDFVRMVETMTQFDTSSKDISVREIREELGLTRDEYNELYNCSLPSIRGYNEGKFWRSAYHSLEQNLMSALLDKDSPAEKTLDRVRKILNRKSLRMLKAEQEKGWPFNAPFNSTTS